MQNKNCQNTAPNTGKSLREELTGRFIPALLLVQSVLFLLAVLTVSATMRSRKTSELQLYASKTVELYGTLARYGDVRYAKFVIASSISSSGLRKFDIYDLKGEQIQESDPTADEKLPSSLLQKAQSEVKKISKTNQTRYFLLEQDYSNDELLLKYIVVTIDGSAYIVAICMNFGTEPWLWIIFILCLGVGLSYFVARYIARSRIASPVAAIEDYASKVRDIDARKDVEFPVPFKEFIPVHIAILEMVENIRTQTKQVAVAQVSQMLSHDLRGPLGTFERILVTSDNEIPAMRNSIRDSLNRMYAMVDALRYSETEHIIKRSTAILDFQFGKEALQHKANAKGIELKIVGDSIPNVSADHAKIERAWMNLVSNALEAAQTSVIVDTKVLDDSELMIVVSDDGPGVPDEFLPKLFQRGATHGKHDGTGLGLAYIRQIMQGHGGDVTYRRENGLTVFECRIPDAIETESEEKVEIGATFEVQLVQKMVRTVAICLGPESLSKSVLAKLASFKTDEFLFSEEREGANIVVSNIDDIMFEVLGGDEQEFIHVTKNWGDEEAIITKLKTKFNLD